MINHHIQWQSSQAPPRIIKVASYHGETEQIWTYPVFFYQVLNTFSQVDDEKFEDTLTALLLSNLQQNTGGSRCHRPTASVLHVDCISFPLRF